MTGVGDERAAAGEAVITGPGRLQLLQQFGEHHRQRNLGVGGRVASRGGDDQPVAGGQHLLEQQLATVGSRVPVAERRRSGEQVVGIGGATSEDVGIDAEQADDPGRYRPQRLHRSQRDRSLGRAAPAAHGREALGGGSPKLPDAEQRIGRRSVDERACLRLQVAQNIEEVTPLPIVVGLLIGERLERFEDPTDPGGEGEQWRAGPFGGMHRRADVQRPNLVDALPQLADGRSQADDQPDVAALDVDRNDVAQAGNQGA